MEYSRGCNLRSVAMNSAAVNRIDGCASRKSMTSMPKVYLARSSLRSGSSINSRMTDSPSVRAAMNSRNCFDGVVMIIAQQRLPQRHDRTVLVGWHFLLAADPERREDFLDERGVVVGIDTERVAHLESQIRAAQIDLVMPDFLAASRAGSDTRLVTSNRPGKRVLTGVERGQGHVDMTGTGKLSPPLHRQRKPHRLMMRLTPRNPVCPLTQTVGPLRRKTRW